MIKRPFRIPAAWVLPLLVFAVVLGGQLWLVKLAGTDIPFMDQWDVEGRWLYPAWQEGSLRFGDLFRAHNGHRIVWTHLLNLALFQANGAHWDPLVQLAAGAALHAGCAAWLMVGLGRRLRGRTAGLMALVIALLSLPVAGWHNALWGFQSQVYFALFFGLWAFVCLDETAPSRRRTVTGWVMLVFAMLSMGPGVLAPVALLGLALVHGWEKRRVNRAVVLRMILVVVLPVIAFASQSRVPENAALHAQSVGQFFTVVGRVLAWPHVDQPWAAVALNLPLLGLVLGRMTGRRRPEEGENFVLLIGGWGVLAALATAWARGGGEELSTGVPSRYVDLVVLLPVANLASLIVLVQEAMPMGRARVRLAALLWSVFLAVGWLGLSAQMVRGIILPRARDPLAPVRLAVAFQAGNDPAVFAGQPRLLVPHPNLDSVRTVLTDPRMKGALPPSLQADQPMGPLSRGVRKILGR